MTDITTQSTRSDSSNAPSVNTGRGDKSINASERLETQKYGTYEGWRDDVFLDAMGYGRPNPALDANNSYNSGVNPTHCTETQV